MYILEKESIRFPNNARRLIVDLLPKEVKLEPITEKRLFVQFLRSTVSSCSKQLTLPTNRRLTNPPGTTCRRTLMSARNDAEKTSLRKGPESKFSSKENY
jgi:hypothetical protein